jgi:DNA-binding Lrp family transcriptional regulator
VHNEKNLNKNKLICEIMNELTNKDKEILYIFNDNSRIPLRQLAKKVNLPENTLRYRIQQFEKTVINNYYPQINSFKLGFNSVKFYTKLKKINSKIKNEMIQYFCQNKSTWIVADVEGEFDIVAIFWFKTINEFYISWQQILNKFSEYLLNTSLYFQTEVIMFKPTYLINTDKRPENEPFLIAKANSTINFDNIDNDILQLLVSNARLTSVNIASQLKLTSNIVSNRIKKLVKNNVIQSYNLNLDISKLGYISLKADIYLTDYKYQNKIFQYIKTCPYLVCVMKSIGPPYLELEFNVKSIQHFHNIMLDMIDNNPNMILNYSYIHLIKSHKISWMPIID